MTIEECIDKLQLYANTENLFLKGTKEQIDLYDSVIKHLKNYQKITLDGKDVKNQEDLEYLYAKLDLLCPKGETSLSNLKLSTRSSRCLVRGGVRSIEQLEKIDNYDLLKIRNLGMKCRREITINFNNWKKKKEEEENDK